MFADPQGNIEQFGLQDGMIVADLGAGTGAYTIAAARKVMGNGRVYAVEVQKEVLSSLENSVAKEGLSNVEVLWGDIERLGGTKIGDRKVDAVIASNVLFQVEDKKGFVQEIKRILKPEGKVLLIDWQDSFGGMGPQGADIILPDAAKMLFKQEG